MARRHRADKPKWWKVILGIIAGILGFILCFYCFSGIINACVNSSRNKYATSYAAVDYAGAQLTPAKGTDGCYTFTTDNDFKIIQFTDVHIGGGYWSVGRDKMALNAVATMITAEKPDLVVVTGDLAYPVPFQAGTLNNKASAKSFAKLMETLGVYWTIVFGNHDTEAYSYFDREDILKFYSSGKYPHCLLTDLGGDEVDGYCNQVIKVKNSSNVITHAVIGLDSHAYTADDPWGVKWGYDCIKQNQVQWYKAQLTAMKAANVANGVAEEDAMPKSTVYFHIPLQEFNEAYHALKDAGVNTVENDGKNLTLPEGISYFEGTFGEDPKKDMVYSSNIINYHAGDVVDGITVTDDQTDMLYETMVQLGSTQGVFCGHDHLNNMRVETADGINLVYGMSIDYLAYGKIKKYGRQRGCTVITTAAGTGNVSIELKNYYENYDAPAKEKAKMNMTSDYYK